MHSLWMLAAGLLFALMGIFVKIAADTFSTAELVFYRSLMQMGVAWIVLARSGLSARTTRLGMHVHRGVAGFVSLFMFYYSLTALPVATAMTLNYTSPLFLALLLTWIARERPGRVLLATVGLGFVGAILLLRPTITADQVWPAAIGLASGAISAIAYWNVRALVRADEPEARVVFYFAVFAALGALLWMTPLTWQRVGLDNVHLLLAIGAFGTAGQLAMTRAYGKGKTLVTAALSYSGIVFSSALGIAVFGDVLPLLAWLGMGMIVAAGIIAVQLQPDAQKASPQVVND